MKYVYLGILVSSLLVTTSVCAQHIKTVKGDASYYVPGHITEEEARNKVLEMARLKAIADEFGTIVSQNNSIVMRNDGGLSEESFQQMSNADVCGEWLRTIEEEVSKELIDGETVLTAKVKGEAREVKSAKVTFTAKILRNGKEDKFESVDFRNRDCFYLSFRTPVSGYLLVYLMDADHNYTRIVPSDEEELCQLKRNQRYVFVDNPDKHIILTCNGTQEINQIYIIFSPNKLYPGEEQENRNNASLTAYATEEFSHVYHLPTMKYKTFQKWLFNLRKQDTEAQLLTQYIRITNPDSSCQEN